MFLAAQLVSIITVIGLALGLFTNKKSNTMLWFTVANIAILVTYLLLGRYLSCILIGGATVRTLIYYIYSRYNKKPHILVMLMFEIYFIVCTIFLWNDYYDLLMLANLLIVSYASWQDNLTILRGGYIVAAIFLIVYDALVGAYVSIASDVLTLMFSTVALIVYCKKSKSPQIQQEDKKD